MDQAHMCFQVDDDQSPLIYQALIARIHSYQKM